MTTKDKIIEIPKDKDTFVNCQGLKLYPAKLCYICNKKADLNVGLCYKHITINKALQSQKQKIRDEIINKLQDWSAEVVLEELLKSLGEKE